MTISIAHLGPTGTYAEAAALAYVNYLAQETGQECFLCPFPTIAQTMMAVAQGQVQVGVVPVENSIEGAVAMTLDSLWQLEGLHIQKAIVLPVSHALLSKASSLEEVKIVYSHPQALAQCQGWLQEFLPNVQLIPANSTTEGLKYLDEENTATISSLRAAELYNLPVLAHPINDYQDNCTRFWVLSLEDKAKATLSLSIEGSHTSLAFSLPANVPGSLLKPLQVFNLLNLNMSRIESRPTKRSLGEYLFFIDLEADINSHEMQLALELLALHTETLKVFGSYGVMVVGSPAPVG
ncbi:prephenate dehydratase [Ancylothrix sp. C2]|uniref:prephenate dehydratase n=1 Tax=Ancylothrix sp. D3o TaxID=2953691 RepID=UPI0021BABBB9|nr:prephenate dehydratase [Ancylothrix sp. D3o]MCT7950207.1 prephenate dehydratase [Ancylothrix sp. D3o]